MPSCNQPIIKCPECKDYSDQPPNSLINANFANALVKNYRDDNGKNYIWKGSQQTEINDARSIWFDLETVKKFIWQIEDGQCENQCNDLLGIRIYFGKYPDAKSEVWDELDIETEELQRLKNYADHHTIFMVPTYWSRDGNYHQDFDPRSKKCRTAIDFTKPNDPFHGLLGGAPDGQNHGNIIPPDSDEGTEF